MESNINYKDLLEKASNKITQLQSKIAHTANVEQDLRNEIANLKKQLEPYMDLIESARRLDALLN